MHDAKLLRNGIQCKRKKNVLEMEKSAMRPSWMYKLGQNIISIEKDFGVGIQDNLSSEKHIDRIFGDTIRC